MCANITTKVSTGVWMRQDFISISRHWQPPKQKGEPSRQSPENTTRRFPTFYLHCSVLPYGPSRGRARARCCNVNPTDPRDTISSLRLLSLNQLCTSPLQLLAVWAFAGFPAAIGSGPRWIASLLRFWGFFAELWLHGGFLGFTGRRICIYHHFRLIRSTLGSHNALMPSRGVDANVGSRL